MHNDSFFSIISEAAWFSGPAAQLVAAASVHTMALEEFTGSCYNDPWSLSGNACARDSNITTIRTRTSRNSFHFSDSRTLSQVIGIRNEKHFLKKRPKSRFITQKWNYNKHASADRIQFRWPFIRPHQALKKQSFCGSIVNDEPQSARCTKHECRLLGKVRRSFIDWLIRWPDKRNDQS